MTAYIIRRLLYTIPIVFGVILILFLIFNVVGGNPVKLMLGKNAEKRSVREIEYELQLDLPTFFNLDAATASGNREACLAALDRMATSGPAPAELLVEDTIFADAQYLDREYRFAVPALMQVLLDPAQPAARRGWASFGLEYISGESMRWRAEKSEAQQEILITRWTRWWSVGDAPREARAAFAPAWSNFFQSQLFHFFWDALSFNFGRSIQTKQRISAMIANGAPASLALTIPGFILGLVISLGLSLICAFSRGSPLDRTLVVLSVLGMSIVSLAYIIAGQYFLAFKLGWFPVHGFKAPYVTYVALPVIIFVVLRVGPNVRFFRTVILDEVNQDYVRTARAKGVSNTGVMLKHVLKNSMVSVITYTVISIPFLFLGSLLLERFFGIPGLGDTMLNAIYSSDFPVVRAFTYISAVLFVIANLVTDICYALVDPRVSLT
jgi:peptide/nickel transport system permease protein